MEKKKIYIIAMEHFDLVWRRCFDRDFEFNGQNFVSYADLEELYIKDNIELCREYPFYNFEIESVAVLQKFLERNPDYEDTIKECIGEGKIYIPFSGINIVDSNLINGESIVRNYLSGYYYLKDKYNYIPDGMDRNDAFGNSGQIPQIARKFGTKWVYHLVYSTCDKAYWQGIDGSVVYDMKELGVGSIGGYRKYRPCPVCGGHKDKHCDYCNDRRIDERYMEKLRFKLNLDEEAVEKSTIPGFIYAGGEEILPLRDIITWAEENRDKYDIEFINHEVYTKHYKEYLDNVDNADPKDIMDKNECNPNNTGCYVTRIKIKQMVRMLESSIFAAEALAMSGLIKNGEYPSDKFEKIWEGAFLSMFHDAVTATHIDAAYDELCDVIGESQKMTDEIIKEQSNMLVSKADNVITVFNPNGIAASGYCETVLKSDKHIDGAEITSFEQDGGSVHVMFDTGLIAPFGTKTFNITDGGYVKENLFSVGKGAAEGEGILTNVSELSLNGEKFSGDIFLENEFYKIHIKNNGISQVYDKKLGTVTAEESEYMVGEWILEHDEGSPWATLSPDMRRQRMAEHTNIVKHEKTNDYEKVTFEVVPWVTDAYAVSPFEIYYSVTLAGNSDKIGFSADVRWDTQNYRLRIAFPTEFIGKHIYEIPYGIIERKPYENNIVQNNNMSNWASAAGDYPAINWAGIDDGDKSIALFNCGTPSYQIDKDCKGKQTIFLSVLRSPSVGTYLHCPIEYSMTGYDGMRDAGNHHFEYALKSYDTGIYQSCVVADGIGFNSRFVPLYGNAQIAEMPEVVSDNARISAVIPSHDGSGMIIRVVEFRGKDGKVEIRLPEYVKEAYETDLKEDIIEKVNTDGNLITADLGHFEIKTFCLKF